MKTRHERRIFLVEKLGIWDKNQGMMVFHKKLHIWYTRRVLNEIAICHTTKAEVQRTVKTLKIICILRQTLFAYKMVLYEVHTAYYELRMICD